jgi:predicted HNH restriction endonuclease
MQSYLTLALSVAMYGFLGLLLTNWMKARINLMSKKSISRDRREYQKEYRKNNKQKRRKYMKNNRQKVNKYINKYNRKRKIQLCKLAMKGYGSKCLFCGEDRPEALIFHHVWGDGNSHRKKISNKYYGLYKWIIENNFPNEIILLCGTCHLILHRKQEELI